MIAKKNAWQMTGTSVVFDWFLLLPMNQSLHILAFRLLPFTFHHALWLINVLYMEHKDTQMQGG